MNAHKNFLHIEALEELFADVQSQQVLADQKTFVDCEPKFPVSVILTEYRKIKNEQDFDLKSFVLSHFKLPENNELPADFRAAATAEEHINLLWDVLTKYPEANNGTLIPLPGKFIVPGGRFREIFYWDSYFTMLGLQVAKRVDLIESMINNFAYLIDEFGFIPNGNRTYFLSRSQPPFFSLMIELLSEEKGTDALVQYLPQLEKEYAFWMNGAEELSVNKKSEKRTVLMPGGEVLNRYWDSLNTPRPEGYVEDIEVAEKAGNEDGEVFRHLRAGAESGWDFSSRWCADKMNLDTIHTIDIVPVDLNCLLLHLEETLAGIYTLKSDKENAEIFRDKYVERKQAILKYFWNEDDKMFADYDFIRECSTGIATAAMAYPLFFKVGTQHQAEATAYYLENKFLNPGGIVTTLVSSGQQWDAPNGWAPLQWIAYKGVMNYGFNELANKIKLNWISNVERVFKQTGKLTEKYNVVDLSLNAGGGEYPNQDGFGWTNGVYLRLKCEK
ncbi:MAG: alpha,alpha-trehalase TreF [Panacibacter sp.]